MPKNLLSKVSVSSQFFYPEPTPPFFPLYSYPPTVGASINSFWVLPISFWVHRSSLLTFLSPLPSLPFPSTLTFSSFLFCPCSSSAPYSASSFLIPQISRYRYILFSLCFYININTRLHFPFNTQKCILKQSTLVFIVHTSSSSFNTTAQQAFVLLCNNIFNYPSGSYFYYKKLFLKNFLQKQTQLSGFSNTGHTRVTCTRSRNRSLLVPQKPLVLPSCDCPSLPYPYGN